MPSPAPTGGLMLLDHAVIAIYMLAMLAMGIAIARRQKSTEDFFVGGRNLPAWAVGLSLFATLLSTITYLGMPGEMFRSGLGFLTRQLGIPIVLVIVWYVWIPFFMRLRLTSAYEYLERRFNYAVRAIAALVCLLLLFGWIAVVVLTAAKATAEIANLNLDAEWLPVKNQPAMLADETGESRPEYRDADICFMILSVGLFSVIYTTMGGIRAVVWTDVVQTLILLAGAFVTMFVVAWETDSGVLDWIRTSRERQYEPVPWFSWDVRERSTIFTITVGMIFWYVCTHGANQTALQRYFAVRDISAARRSFLVNTLIGILLGFLLAGIGISLMHFVAHHESSGLAAAAGIDSPVAAVRNESQDKIFPQFIRSGYFPVGLRGFLVAALLAAAMSTIDSGSNSISTLVTIDFVRRLSRHGTTPAGELKLARILTATIGAIVVAASIGLYFLSRGTDLVTLCQKGFNLFLGPLGGLFFLALFSKRVTPAPALFGLALGEIVGVLTSYRRELFGVEFSTHLVIPAAWTATVASGWLAALVLGTRATDEQAQWTFWPVVRGPDVATPAIEGAGAS